MGQWYEISVMIGRECEDAAGEILMEQGAAGYSVEDPRLAEAADVRWVGDYWPDVSDDGTIVLKGYFSSPLDERVLATMEARLRSLEQFGLEVGFLELKAAIVDEEDWAHAWKKHYHTETYGRIVIRPVWEDFDADEEQFVIAMDPGMAFGTGGHPTTSMCLLALQELPLQGRSLWDVGSGSGILSCAAGKLGAHPITACDIDPVAVEASRVNTARNGVEAHCIQGVIEDLHDKADVIVANIIADVIVPMIAQIPERLLPGGHYIASGIIENRVPEVREALRRAGMSIVQEWQQGEWYCVLAALC